MKYQKFDWPSFLNARLEAKGVRQIDLAKRWGMKPQSIHGLLNRSEHKLESLKKLSHFLGEDLVFHCLSVEYQEVLRKAWEAGVRPGEDNPMLDWQVEKAQVLEELEAKKASVDQLGAEVKKLKSEKATLANENARLREEVERLREDMGQQLNSMREAHEKELGQLKEVQQKFEYESRLKISVLEAKLEVLQGK